MNSLLIRAGTSTVPALFLGIELAILPLAPRLARWVIPATGGRVS